MNENQESVTNKLNRISDEWRSFSSNAELISKDISHLKGEILQIKGEINKMNNISQIPELHLNYEEKSTNLLRFIKSSHNDISTKSYSSTNEMGGGHLIEAEKYKKIVDLIKAKSPIRQLASSDTISSNVLEIVTNNAILDSGWVEEEELRGNTNEVRLDSKRILVHELFAQPKATQRLLNDSFVNIEQWLTEKLVDSFAKAENNAFVRGNGIAKPRGFLTYDETIIEKINGVDEEKIKIDDLFNLINSLDEEYLGNAHFVMHRKTLSDIQKFRDDGGRLIWQSSLSEKLKDTILGIPVVCTDDMPIFGEDSIPIALGDFKQAYKIVDRQGINIMKDPFTEKPFVKFYATKRVGGDVINNSAIKLLKY